MLVWKKYTEWAEKQVGKITYASWRNKRTGWHDSWAMGIDGVEHGEKINWHDSYDILIRGKKSYIESRLSEGDMFFKLFLTDSCLGKQCYNKCKYKFNSSSADIRIGDLWGTTYEDNEEGVSAAISFTANGYDILNSINCLLVKHTLDIVAEYQMKECPHMPVFYDELMRKLNNSSLKIEEVYPLILKLRNKSRQIQRLKHPIRTFVNVLKKIIK